MLLSFATLVAGLVLLVGGGTALVRGASEIAASLGVSPLVVGLTVVAFGTSAPELVVNSISAIEGQTGLAFGNVLGSNISNFALVLGAAALMTPIYIQGDLVRREIPLLLLATTVMTVMAMDASLENGVAAIGRIDSIVLLLLFLIFIYTTALDFLRTRRPDALLADIERNAVMVSEAAHPYRWPMAIGGAVLLFAGGSVAVRGAVALAADFGMSATIIGLFVVAIGTSMPELVTSIIAAMRKESDLAVGNIVGSNLFNSLIVLPITGLIRPIPVPEGGLHDAAAFMVSRCSIDPDFRFQTSPVES